VVSIDLSPKPLSVDDGDWTEGPVDEIAGAYNGFLTAPKGQRDFVAWYATEVMVQRDLTEAELAWLVNLSLNTPYYVAAMHFASGMFSDYIAEAQQVDEARPSLYVIAEHWADTAVAFVNKHCPNTKTEVLGGHLMFWEHADKFNQILDDFLASL
jgi:non-heme chloroperoxidase